MSGTFGQAVVYKFSYQEIGRFWGDFMSIKDMKGQRFGHLTVIQRSSRRNAKQQVYWVCRCDCGRLFSTRGDNLRRGITTRCSDCWGKGRKSVFVEEGDEHGVV